MGATRRVNWSFKVSGLGQTLYTYSYTWESADYQNWSEVSVTYDGTAIKSPYQYTSPTYNDNVSWNLNCYFYAMIDGSPKGLSSLAKSLTSSIPRRYYYRGYGNWSPSNWTPVTLPAYTYNKNVDVTAGVTRVATSGDTVTFTFPTNAQVHSAGDSSYSTLKGYDVDYWYCSATAWFDKVGDRGTNKFSPGSSIILQAEDVTTGGSQQTNLYWHAVLKERTYTITFNADNGTTGVSIICSPTSKTVKYGSTYGTLPTPLAKLGSDGTPYNFVQWNTKADGTGTTITADTKVTITSDTTLYAIWKANNVRVNFDAQGGAISGFDGDYYIYSFGSVYNPLPNAVAYDGYTFSGWWTEKTGGTQVTTSTIITKINTHTLWAHWTVNSYTATFKPNSGTWGDGSTGNKTSSYTIETALKAPGSISRTGYDFNGWKVTTASGNWTTADPAYTSFSKGKYGSPTFTAQWSLKTYEVTYNGNGNTGGTVPSTQTKKYGVNLTLSSTKLTKSDTTNKDVYTIKYNTNWSGGTAPASQKTTQTVKYVHDGWATSASGSKAYNLGATYTDNKDIALYAYWNKTTTNNTILVSAAISRPNTTPTGYKVTYNANGGNSTPPAVNATNTVSYAQESGKEWSDGTNYYKASTNYAFSVDKTLYANWKSTTTYGSVTLPKDKITKNSSSVDRFIVSFNANGHGTTPSSITQKNVITYTHDGWATSASGSKAYDLGASYKPEKDITLYAHYTTVEEKKSITLPNITATGFTFNGWYTDATGGTKVGTNGNAYTPTKNIILYAHWTVNTYNVDYDYTGGTSSVGRDNCVKSGEYTYLRNPTYVAYDNSHYELIEGTKRNTYFQSTAPTKTGYTFTGWDITGMDKTQHLFWYDSKSNAVSTEIFSTVGLSSKSPGAAHLRATSGTVKFTAQWSANSYKVTADANGGTIPTTSGWTIISGSKTATKSVTFDSTYGTLPTPSRTGYTFKGWFTEKTDGNRVQASTIMKTAADHIIYAQWDVIKNIKLTANANGGTIPVTSGWNIATDKKTATKDLTFDSTYETLPTPIRVGYKFKGWYTATSGGTLVTSSTKVTTTTARTIYALWDPISMYIYDDKGNPKEVIGSYVYTDASAGLKAGWHKIIRFYMYDGSTWKAGRS